VLLENRSRGIFLNNRFLTPQEGFGMTVSKFVNVFYKAMPNTKLFSSSKEIFIAFSQRAGSFLPIITFLLDESL